MTRWEARELDSEDDNSHTFLGCLKHHALKATAFRFAASNQKGSCFTILDSRGSSMLYPRCYSS